MQSNGCGDFDGQLILSDVYSGFRLARTLSYPCWHQQQPSPYANEMAGPCSVTKSMARMSRPLSADRESDSMHHIRLGAIR